MVTEKDPPQLQRHNKIPAKRDFVGNSRLYKFKEEHGKEILSEGNQLAGAGCLTEIWIQKLQNCDKLKI